jgi:hypothetical protein
MRMFLRTLGLLGACLLTLGGTASGQEAGTGPSYTNVQIVSIDPQTRIVVIRTASGAEETLELDDTVGVASVKAGDRVILGVRNEPGRKRISSITRAASPSPRPISPTAKVAAAVPAPAAGVEARSRFADQVAALSRQAQPIDAVWSQFVTSCAARGPAETNGARAWFGLWDGSVKSDLSSGFCRDLFNQMVQQGETIKKGMAAAEDVARPDLAPEDLRAIKKLNSMNWDGWALAAPETEQP